MMHEFDDLARERGLMTFPVHSIAGYTFLKKRLKANLDNAAWVAQQTEETLVGARQFLCELNMVLEEVDPHEQH